MTRGRERADSTKQTAKRLDVFLARLEATFNVSKACKSAGISRAYVYELRKNDPDFAARWSAAIDAKLDRLEEEAVKRATRRKNPSDRLLEFLLKSHRPDRYKEQKTIHQEVTISGLADRARQKIADRLSPREE